jgi:predicted DCC family thiol-disulfide oxidoreductase YuxK
MSVDPSSCVSGEALPEGPIVLFDAQCVLCSANAHFILTHDKAERFRLASMQGEVGASLFRAHGVDPSDPTSISCDRRIDRQERQ